MRSITTKLILAFLSIGIISVAVLSITARWNTRQEFIRFLSDQNQNSIVTTLTEYHLKNGTWDGVEVMFPKNKDHQPPGSGEGFGGPNRPPQFTLTSVDGKVIASNEHYKAGDQVTEEDIELGTPINENGQVVGILIPVSASFPGTPRELEFIDRTNLTLVYGALIGAVIALFIGIVLSRTITRPIRELTHATHAISEGDLTQKVQVRSKDEIGELGKAFNKMSTELSRSVNTRKQMTADIAHELRTPLSLILGHAEAVHDGVLPPSKENFEIIREEAGRLEHLVDDLRTLSLADAGELTISLQPVDPGQLLQDIASLYKVRAQQKDIQLQLVIASHLSTLEIDPGRITQVITNILDNALRHTPQNGRIILSAKQFNEAVEIAISDNGPGLSPEDIDRIFERFYRADPSRHREQGGSGLGLAIAKSIVQAHNGQISAESEAGKGLRVIIKFPTTS